MNSTYSQRKTNEKPHFQPQQQQQQQSQQQFPQFQLFQHQPFQLFQPFQQFPSYQVISPKAEALPLLINGPQFPVELVNNNLKYGDIGTRNSVSARNSSMKNSTERQENGNSFSHSIPLPLPIPINLPGPSTVSSMTTPLPIPTPNSNTTQNSNSDSNSFELRKFKTKLCRHWKSGYCLFGPSCVFAHGVDDLCEPNLLMNVNQFNNVVFVPQYPYQNQQIRQQTQSFNPDTISDSMLRLRLDDNKNGNYRKDVNKVQSMHDLPIDNGSSNLNNSNDSIDTPDPYHLQPLEVSAE